MVLLTCLTITGISNIFGAYGYFKLKKDYNELEARYDQADFDTFIQELELSAVNTDEGIFI